MKVLVWQWGRRGAGPRYAVELAAAFSALPDTQAMLSLAEDAEIRRGVDAPACDLIVPTYGSVVGLGARALTFPLMVVRLAAWLRRNRPAFAVCAMPGPLDWVFALALRRVGIPFAVIVHDAVAHPGDGYPFQMRLQRLLLRSADAVIALSSHVLEQVRGQVRDGVALGVSGLPPFPFGPMPPVLAHDGPVQLLFFGRLLDYKGLDLLAEAVPRLEAGTFVLRVAGSGPESVALARLRAWPGVTVENRWFAEEEIGPLLGWADALVLPYREATQSGVAAAALAAGRFVVATRVGGLIEQLGAEPSVVLCDADGGSLADALRRFIAGLPQPRAAPDVSALWHAHAAEIAAVAMRTA